MLISGEKGKQRLAAAVPSSETRDWPGDDVTVRGDRLSDLQHPTTRLEHPRDFSQRPAAVVGADGQFPGYHQQQHQLHHLRDLRQEVQEDIPEAVLQLEAVWSRQGQPRVSDLRRVDCHQCDQYRDEELHQALSPEQIQHYEQEQQCLER